MLKKCCAFVLIAIAASAQTRFFGPVAGYVYEAGSGSLRPIFGIPGAAYVADAVIAGADWASVHPDGQFGLVSSQGVLYLVRGLENHALEWIPVAAALPLPERVAWGEGAAAVAAGTQVQVLTGFDGVPVVAATAGFETPVTALLLDDDSAIVAVESGIHLAGAPDGPRLVASLDGPAALAMYGPDVFAADRAGRIHLLGAFREQPILLPFAEDPTGMLDPVGLAAVDGKLLVAGRSRKVAVYDLASRMLENEIALGFEPAFLQPLANGLFLLNEAVAGVPLQVMDPARGYGVFFIPISAGQ
jgi:hypothetical protein